MKGSLHSYVASGLTDTLPLLSYLGITHQRNSLIKDVINWFDNEIEILNFGAPGSDSRIFITENIEEKGFLLNMLKEMDVDIADIRHEISKDNSLEVYTTHAVDGNAYELDLREESSGTLKLFGVLPYVVICIQGGGTLVVDELDAKLHPVLLKYIISLFVNPAINKRKSQLIFTSHDLSTMTNELFRRDEIWFVAKDKSEASQMYSLVEFKDDSGKTPRKDASYNKQYLEGRYGANPYLKKIINWGEY